MRLRVPELLKHHGMTAYALAKASDDRISLSTATRLARSGDFGMVSADVLDALCDIFGVEPGELFDRGKGRRRRR